MLETEQFPPKQWDVYWNVLTCKQCANLYAQLVRLVNIDAVERHIQKVIKHVMAEHYPAPMKIGDNWICARDKYEMSRHNICGEYKDDFGNLVPCGTLNPRDKRHYVIFPESEIPQKQGS